MANGEHRERLQLGPFRDAGRVEGTPCRQLRQMQVAEGRGQHERVVGSLREQRSSVSPRTTAARGYVHLQVDQRSIDTLARAPIACRVPQLSGRRNPVTPRVQRLWPQIRHVIRVDSLRPYSICLMISLASALSRSGGRYGWPVRSAAEQPSASARSSSRPLRLNPRSPRSNKDRAGLANAGEPSGQVQSQPTPLADHASPLTDHQRFISVHRHTHSPSRISPMPWGVALGERCERQATCQCTQSSSAPPPAQRAAPSGH